MQHARTIGSIVLGVVFVVLLPFTLLVLTVTPVLTDTDKYAATVGPLADDPVVQAAVRAELERRAFDLVDLDAQEQRISDYLQSRRSSRLARAGVAALTAAAVEQIRSTVHDTVEQVVASPQFRDWWDRANREAHVRLLAILRGDDDALVGSDGQLRIDLAPAFAIVAERLAGERLVALLPPTDIEVEMSVIDEERLTRAQDTFRALESARVWIPALTLVSFAGCLALARRRLPQLAGLAMGGSLSTGAMVLALGRVREHLVEASARPELVGVLWDAVVSEAPSSARVLWLAAALAIAAALAVAAGSRTASLPFLRSRASLDHVVDLFVYVVILNLAVEFAPSVISEGFTMSLLTAVLLKVALEVVIKVKGRVLARFKAAESRTGRVTAGLALWGVAFSSKFVVLELVALVFGDAVSLGGFFSVTGLVVVLLLSRRAVRWALRAPDDDTARTDDPWMP
jgi:hypothetical protein